MAHWIIRLLISGLSLLLADWVLDGVHLSGYVAALGGALILGIVNALVRPVLVILTLPLTFFTLGLFLLVVNAFTYWMASALVPGFDVQGFWGAFSGAIVTSVFSWLLNVFTRDSAK